jgi:hypothetical protein
MRNRKNILIFYAVLNLISPPLLAKAIIFQERQNQNQYNESTQNDNRLYDSLIKAHNDSVRNIKNKQMDTSIAPQTINQADNNDKLQTAPLINQPEPDSDANIFTDLFILLILLLPVFIIVMLLINNRRKSKKIVELENKIIVTD